MKELLLIMKEIVNEWKLSQNWVFIYNYQTGNKTLIILFHMLKNWKIYVESKLSI